MDQSASNQFRTALVYLLDREGRGAQTRLADSQDIDRGYMNAIVRGRKPGSEKLRGKIAAHFGMVYEEMLALGRRILNGEDPLPLDGEKVEHQKQGQTDTDQKSGLRNLTTRDPKYGEGSENIPDRIVSAIDVLGSDTKYADLLAGLIDALHDTVSTKRENKALKEEISEMKSRIARLENRAGNENEHMRKTA